MDLQEYPNFFWHIGDDIYGRHKENISVQSRYKQFINDIHGLKHLEPETVLYTFRKQCENITNQRMSKDEISQILRPAYEYICQKAYYTDMIDYCPAIDEHYMLIYRTHIQCENLKYMAYHWDIYNAAQHSPKPGYITAVQFAEIAGILKTEYAERIIKHLVDIGKAITYADSPYACIKEP